MLTLKKIISSTALIIFAFGLTGCAFTPHYQQTPANVVATQVLAPIATWNPVAGASSNPGSAASGRLDEQDGRFQIKQTFEVWNVAGTPLPKNIRQRHEQRSNNYRQRGYNSQRRYPRGRYNSRGRY